MPFQVFESSPTVNWPFGLAVAITTAFLLYQRRQAVLDSKNGVPLPPGPPAKWFWQTALPSVNTARGLADWVAEYGPVVALRQGSQVTIIIGRVDAATEIMEKNGAALVDRPRFIAAGELLAKGLQPVLVGTGERFRRYRKAMHTHLQPKALVTYQDMLLENAKILITDILNDPKNHQVHAQQYAASAILRVAYGKSTPTSNNDPEFVQIHQALKNTHRVMRPGAFLVDSIPLLRYIPGYGHQLEQYHRFELRLFKNLMGRVRSEMESDKGGSSFMRTLLEHTDEHKLTTNEMAYLAGGLYGAAADAISVAITNTVLTAACYPEAQRRVQEELDTVIGSSRMPTWEDYDSLPQVRAFVLETLRWRPVTPIGFAHRATEDIIWRGQRIPAGATVIGNHLAISQDPVAFPEPEKFDPQRWIHDGRIRSDMTSYPFGYGRRVCPGRYLAGKSLYIDLILLLWSFRIVERPDAPIDQNAYSDNLVAHVAPFKVEFIPRVPESRLRELTSESEMI